MKFKDILNRDLVNLENCEQEPIHIPGSIQSHGFLLGVTMPELKIDFCSGNSLEFIQLRYEQLLGKDFQSVFGETATNHLTKYIAGWSNGFSQPLEIELAAKIFTCIIQKSDSIYILEFEPSPILNIAVSDIYQQTRQFTGYMKEAVTLQKLCQLVAEETRKLTGYDRVMIYRFDEDNNGEVFAESRIESIEPFLGLHYPHTDIPVQARELYIKNLLRLIVDVDYQPVPLYTIDDSPNKNLDLGLSTLRSVSPIHIRYLKNMGVAGTLTISLIHENKLWGLITCHHYTPKYITRDIRIAAQLQGHFLTSQISVRQLAEEYEVAKKVNAALDELLTHLFSSDDTSINDIIKQDALPELSNASGVIIIIDDVIYSRGNVPPEDEIKKLTNWLHTYNAMTGFNTCNLSRLYPDAKKICDSASGVIFHSLGSRTDNCIIWCRPEALQVVNWAGDPKKAIIKDENGISPRKSFALWKEIKQCESNKWSNPEILAAANFASALQKHVHMMFLTKEELKQRKLSEKLREANAELENLNWIGSHDLKEPLRKIQLFASRILDKKDSGVSESIISSVAKMNESAKRMQILIRDILSYSKLNHINEGFEIADLNELVKNIITELGFEISEKKATVEYHGLPRIKGIPFLLQQLFVNLLRNALKFSKVDEPPHITISCIENDDKGMVLHSGNNPGDGQFHKIMVSDNGIGFDNQFSFSIFKVFTRLHDINEYGGSGVGLALCKRIMQNHNGYITAEGVPGKGAVFSLYFPVIT